MSVQGRVANELGVDVLDRGVAVVEVRRPPNNSLQTLLAEVSAAIAAAKLSRAALS